MIAKNEKLITKSDKMCLHLLTITKIISILSRYYFKRIRGTKNRYNDENLNKLILDYWE